MFIDWLPVALCGFYLLLTFGAPVALGSPRLLLDHPSIVLWGWITSLVTAMAALLGAMTLLIVRSIDRRIGANDINDWFITLIDVLGGWLAIAVLGFVIFRIGAAASELRAQRRQRDSGLLALQASATAVVIAGMPASRVVSPEKFIGVISTSQRVIFSSGLERALSPAQLGAAVSHEIEHVRGFHDTIRGIGSLALATAPGLSASKKLAQAARIATELIADDAAAKEFGAETVASALAAAYPDAVHTHERIERLRSAGRT